MNLLEHYIKKIHKTTEHKSNSEWIIVDVTVDCYGVTQRIEHFTTKEEWKKEKEQGFFLA